MNNIHVCHTRNRNESKLFSSINFSITNYSTDAQSKAMKNVLGDTLPINIGNLHLIPDPLKKNLADSVITGTMEQRKEPDKFERLPSRIESETRGSLGGITNFFSGVFNVMTAMFQKRTPSPTTQYYDCFDDEMMPSLAWHTAKLEIQNKDTVPNSKDMDNMSVVTNCEEKHNQVQLFLNENVQKYPTQVYVEPRSFEDAFCPENIVRLSNDTVIECLPAYSAYNQHEQELLGADAPIIKTKFCTESMDIVKNVPENEKGNVDVSKNNIDTSTSNFEKNQIVSTCEDKLNKLKELMQCKRNIKSFEETTPIPIKEVISSSFGNEVGSIEEAKNSFNEVNGRFYSSSVDSDDSFQIVFTDRKRLPSDCESEDSFIVFEESPDCYTNNDVFGSESESEKEDSDYIMTCLNHSFSRTFEDLTDDSLYGKDEVDCVVRMGEAVQTKKENISYETENRLVDEKKQDKNQKLPKKVRFSTDPPKVHVMRVWAFAARQARAGHWERYALDRDRFRRRIADVEMAISWVLKPQHRSCVMFQRFMPWWNSQKRKELAEKKALEEKGNVKTETKMEEEETTEKETKLKEAVKNSVLEENDVTVNDTLSLNENDCIEENKTKLMKEENVTDINLENKYITKVNTALFKEKMSTEPAFLLRESDLQENTTNFNEHATVNNLGDEINEMYEIAKKEDNNIVLKRKNDQQANVGKGQDIQQYTCNGVGEINSELHVECADIHNMEAEESIQKINNKNKLNIFSSKAKDLHENYSDDT